MPTPKETITLDIAADAIGAIDASHRDTWLQVGMALKMEFGDEAFSLWDQWSRSDDSYNKADARSVWKSFKPTGKVTIGTFIYLAKQAGYSFPREELSDAERQRRQAEADQRCKELTRQRREAARLEKEKARVAALRAQKMWANLLETGEAQYLARKQAPGYGLRFSPKGSAVAKLQDGEGSIHGLQFLLPDGGKRFWPKNMRVTGHYHPIGQPAASGRVHVGVCEGYATGASIYEATQIPLLVAFNAGNLKAVAQVARRLYPDAQIIVFGDDDYQTEGNPGETKARDAAKSVKGWYLLPKFQNRTDQKWTDFNDLHAQEGLDIVKDQIMQAVYGGESQPIKTKKKPVFPDIPPNEEWRYNLAYTQTGKPQATINNTRLVLANDSRWKGVLGYCDFSYAVMKLQPPPFENNADTGEWSDADTARLRCWLAEHYEFSPKNGDADEAVLVAAQAHRFHPVRDYLNSLKWDGIERLYCWLSDFLGAEQNEYTIAVGIKWLVGAVARVMKPGCKMDNVLILEGMQDAGKSTVLSILGGEWFSDTHFELGNKDAYQQLRGIWIYEMAELDAFNKAESTRAKAFFSAQVDNYRPSYGRRNINVPRQSVIGGTTNQDHYLKDVTGNRRYWPVRCTEINFKLLREARDQLWAEAVHLYKTGIPWHVLPDERELFGDAQENRFQEDVWENTIIEWLEDPEQRLKNEFSTADIMAGALRMTPDKMKPPEQIRVGLIMKRLGWEKKRRRISPGKFKWVYVRPEEERKNAGLDDPPM